MMLIMVILGVMNSIGLWIIGIDGMILFLPFTAMLKVVCEEYEELKPVALLIGDQSEPKKLKIVEKWLK